MLCYNISFIKHRHCWWNRLRRNRDGTDKTDSRPTLLVTATCRGSARRWGRARATFYIRTPRPTRSRVTAASGRSPGLRVIAFDHLPRNLAEPSGDSVESLPLTVAGAAAALHTEVCAPRSLLIPCGNHCFNRGSRRKKRQASPQSLKLNDQVIQSHAASSLFEALPDPNPTSS